MKLFVHFLILLVVSGTVAAQNKGQAKIDSLRGELARQKADTNCVKLLNLLAYGFEGQYDSVIKYATKAKDLASQLTYKRGLASAYNTLGNNYDEVGNFEAALKCHQACLKIRLAMGDKKRIGGSYCNIGNVYRQQFNFPMALESYLNAVKVLEEIKEKAFLANTYYGLGVLYTNWGNFPQALKYHQAALELRQELGVKPQIAYSMSCIGDVYCASGQFEKALDCHKGALKFEEENGLGSNMCISYIGIGRAYKAMKNYAEALENDQIALKLAEENNDFQAIIIENTEIAQIYVEQGKYANAEPYAKKALQIAEQVHSLQDIQLNQRTLSEVYAHTGRYQKSLESFKAYDAAKDSIVNKENIEKVARATLQFEFDKKEAIAKAEQEKKDIETVIALDRQKMMRNSFIGGFATVLLFSGVVVRSSRRHRKQNTLLKREKLRSDGLMQNLEESLAQKDLLMKEIHHRVKNNLQVISALLELQLENVNDAGAIDAMTESTTRVRSISLIHQQLYQDEQLTAIEISKFASDLFQQVSVVFKKDNHTVIFNNNVPVSLQDIDTAVPLGLILNELMTNSYKYAFGKSEPGSVTIDYKHSDGLNHLIYSDSGPGLPENFNIDSVKSLGMRVMRNLCKQLGGKFEYDRENKNFHISFKDLVERKKVV